MDYSPRAILIAGTIASGKDKFSDILEQYFGYEKHSFGQVVAARATRLGMPTDRDSLQTLGYQERKKRGVHTWVNDIVRKVNSEKVSVNGLRYPQDLTGLRLKLYRQAPLIWVDAPMWKRFHWQKNKRKRNGDPQTRRDFVTADERDRGIFEGGQQTADLETMADYRIWNGGSEDEFLLAIHYTLREMGIGTNPILP